jgi:hypothetical protein
MAALIRESCCNFFSWLVSSTPAAAPKDNSQEPFSYAKVDEMTTNEPERAKTEVGIQKEKDLRVKFLARLISILPYLDRNQTQFAENNKDARNAQKINPIFTYSMQY